MNACLNCGECVDTGCLCPARVAKSKPVDGGNVQLPEVEIEQLAGWEMAIVWTSILVIGVYGIALAFTGLDFFYQAASSFLQTFFN